MDKALFNTKDADLPKTDAINEAGGIAYKLDPRAALAQLAATGCFNNTYYTEAREQLGLVLALCEGIFEEHGTILGARFIGQTAIYAREKGRMKDMPAFLTAFLACRLDHSKAGDSHLFREVFTRVIHNAKMLRNFVQVIRSNVLGRRSFGTAIKRAIYGWFLKQEPIDLFRQSAGNDPSLADIIKMIHPKAVSPSTNAMYRYLIGKPLNPEQFVHLPDAVRSYDGWKRGEGVELPDVPFLFLEGLDLKPEHYKQIARKMSWWQTRMRLNWMDSHGVFDDPRMVQIVAERLADKEQIERAKPFPYQIYITWKCTGQLPQPILDALHDAMDWATRNMPGLHPDGVAVCPDVSGSMSVATTGYRKGATSAATCIDISALYAAVIMRTNDPCYVLPFSTRAFHVRLDRRSTVMDMADTLGSLGGGGTNCSLPLAALIGSKTKVGVVVYVSDYESWMDSPRQARYGAPSGMRKLWKQYQKEVNPDAKLVCIDITPHKTVQVPDDPSILNIGGFSDSVFEVVRSFVSGDSPDHWVDVIEKVE